MLLSFSHPRLHSLRSSLAVLFACFVMVLLFHNSLTVSAAASADVFDALVVSVVSQATPQSFTLAGQTAACTELGGHLYTDASPALHTKLTTYMTDIVGLTAYRGYLGGSTIASTSCPLSTPSLNCVWRWNTGRYAAANAALPFYRGNYRPDGLDGAGALNGLPSYWMVVNGTQRYPGPAFQRYLVLQKGTGDADAGWMDDGSTIHYYVSVVPADCYAMCVIEPAVATSTTSSSSEGNSLADAGDSSIADPNHAPHPTTDNGQPVQPRKSEHTLSAGAWAGIAVSIAVVAAAVAGVVGYVCLTRPGCCCHTPPTAAVAVAAGSPALRSGPSVSPDSRRSSLLSDGSYVSSRSPTSSSVLSSRSTSVSPAFWRGDGVDDDDAVVCMKGSAGSNHGSDAFTNDDAGVCRRRPAFSPFTAASAVAECTEVEEALSRSRRTVPHSMETPSAVTNPFSPPTLTAVAAMNSVASDDGVPASYAYTATPEATPGTVRVAAAEAEVAAQPALSRTRRLSVIRSPSQRTFQRPPRRSSSVSFVNLDEKI